MGSELYGMGRVDIFRFTRVAHSSFHRKVLFNPASISDFHYDLIVETLLILIAQIVCETKRLFYSSMSTDSKQLNCLGLYLS